MKICAYHLCSNELTGKKIRFCSKKCCVKAKVVAWRKRTKQRAVEYLGGKCLVCGYDRCIEVLEFHHRDPAQKDFGIAASGSCRSWDRIQTELDKCDLLCANCHRERHAAIDHRAFVK